jgi:hypothetical protein
MSVFESVNPNKTEMDSAHPGGLRLVVTFLNRSLQLAGRYPTTFILQPRLTAITLPHHGTHPAKNVMLAFVFRPYRFWPGGVLCSLAKWSPFI